MTDVSDRSAPPGTGTRSRARVIALCWTAIVVDGYDLIVYGTVLPTLISGEWALDAGTAGWIGSLALVGMLVGALLAGTVTDRLGRRRLMIICIAWFSVAMALCALARRRRRCSACCGSSRASGWAGWCRPRSR